MPRRPSRNFRAGGQLSGLDRGVYGDALTVPVITLDSRGNIIGISSVAIDAVGGGGAPSAAKYIVTEAHAGLSAEIVIPSMAGHPDIVPASPNAKDDEFNASSLDGKWAWLNQGSSTIVFNDPDGWATITPQSSNWRGITQAVPGGNWTVTAKLSSGFGFINDGYAGIWIHGGTDGTGDVWCLGKDGGSSIATRCEQISGYSFSGTRTNTNVTWGAGSAYLRITWDGTNLQTWISLDGIRYNRFTAFAPGYSPTKIGIATRSSSGFASSFDWFRVV